MSSGIQRFLAVSFVLGLGVTLTPPAGATEAPAKVTIEVTHKGNYVASLCGFDWLGGYCHFDVRPGQVEKFPAYPRPGDPVWARVVPNKGGFAEEPSSEVKTDRVCFEAAGTRKNPTVQEVACK